MRLIKPALLAPTAILLFPLVCLIGWAKGIAEMMRET